MIHPPSRRQTGHWRFDEPLVPVDFGFGPAQVDWDHLRIRPDALGKPVAPQPGNDRRGRDCAKPTLGHADRRTKRRFELPAIARRAVADQMHRLLGVRQRLRSEEHTSELQSLAYLVCRLLLEKKKKKITVSVFRTR